MKINDIQVKILKKTPGLLLGQTYRVPANAEGIALDRIWRRRISNAQVDNSLELVQSNPFKKPTKKTVKASAEETSNDSD